MAKKKKSAAVRGNESRSTKSKATKKRATKKSTSKKEAPSRKKSSRKKSSRKKTSKKKTSKKKVVTKKKKVVTKKPSRKRTAKKKVTKRVARKKTTSTAKKKLSLAHQLFYGVDENGKPTGKKIDEVAVVAEKAKGGVILSSDGIRNEFRRRRSELEPQRKKAQAVLDEILIPRIQKGMYGPISSYSIGFRVKHGKPLSPLKYVIQVGVPEKYTEEMLKRKKIRRLPKKIEGVEIKVIESQPSMTRDAFEASATEDSEFSAIVMPSGKTKLTDLVDITESSIEISDTDLWGGLPAADTTELKNWGTFGVSFKKSNQHFALVNQHFAKQVGVTMAQPASKPGGNLTGWEIGKVEKVFIGQQTQERGYVDAALIKLQLDGNRKSVHRILSFESEELLFASRRLNDSDDMFAKVFKDGARSKEKLEADIVNTAKTISISGGDADKVIAIEGTSSGTRFIKGGDSGSAVVAPVLVNGTPRLLVVGLFFAGDKQNKALAYACHFQDVIDALTLDLPDRLLCDNWTYE